MATLLPRTRNRADDILARPLTHGEKLLGYVPGLDGLRAVSVLAVLAYHGGMVRTWPGGFLGVEVFFVISGYLITSVLLAERRRTGATNLGRFYLRRARRLLPALFLMLAVTTAFTLLFLDDSVSRLRDDMLASIFYINNWWQLVTHQSYLAGAGRPPLLRHVWSLAVEEQFYLIWPFFFALGFKAINGRRNLIVGVLVGIAVSTVSMALLFHPYEDNTFVYYATHTRAAGLLVGVLLALVWSPDRLRGVPGRGAGLVLDLAGVLGLVVMYQSFRHVNDFDPYIYRGGMLVLDIGTMLVIAALVFPRAHINRLYGITPLVWIGLRSYGIYLWHWPIFQVTRPGLDVPLHGIWLMVLRFGLTFLAADLSFRYVETPIRQGAIGRYVQTVRAERGMRRSRLVRRGAVITGVVVLSVTLLGLGLAGSKSPPVVIAGIDPAEAAAQEGNAGKPADNLEAIRKQFENTPTTSGGPTSRPAEGKPVATTPVVGAPGAPPILAIGDSVMLGAKSALEREFPGQIYVDAKVSRQFSHAIEVLRVYKEAGLIGPVVFVHLGTNGAFSDAQFDQMMQIISPSRAIFFNSRVPRTWEPTVNERLSNGVARWRNATLVNWHDLANKHDNYFVSDGFHPTTLGQHFYAKVLHAAM